MDDAAKKVVSEQVKKVLQLWEMSQLQKAVSYSSEDMMHIVRAVSPEPEVLRELLKKAKLIRIQTDGTWTLTEDGLRLKSQIAGSIQEQDASKSGLSSELNWSDFRNLIRYYLACLEVESPRNYYLKPESYGRDYCIPKSLEPFWLRGLGEPDKSHFLTFQPSESAMMTATMNRKDPDQAVCLGYPVLAFFNEDGQADTYVPLALIPIKAVFDGIDPKAFKTRTVETKFLFDQASLNQKWVESCVPREYHRELYYALDNLSVDGTFDLKLALPLILGYSRYSSVLCDPDKLVQHLPKIHERTGRRPRTLCNTAMVFRLSENRYTKGLVRELKDLLEIPAPELDKTALAYIYRDPPLKTREVDDKVGIPFMQSNAEQLQAVERALNFPVVQLQGPPGTGKSQVAVNLMANCIYRGESVLFSSKNHNAVDAIKERAKTLVGENFSLVQFCIDEDDRESWFKSDYHAYKSSLANLMTSKVRRLRLEVDNNAEVVHTIDQKFKKEELHALRFIECQDDFEAAEASAKELLVPLDCNIEQFDLESFSSIVEALVSYKGRGLRGTAYRFVHSRGKHEKDLAALDHYGRMRDVYENSSQEEFEKKAKAVIDAIRRYETKKVELDSAYEEMQQHEIEDAEELVHKHNLAMSELEKHGISALISKWNDMANALDQSDFERLDAVRVHCSSQGGRSKWTQMSLSDRTLMSEALKIQQTIQPAWATTLLSAWLASPMLPAVFDQLIIDEASQCDLISIVPMLFRAKRVTFIGDPEQFKPIINMREHAHRRIWDSVFHGDDRRWRFSYFEHSAYSVLDGVVDSIMLKEHFRCDAGIAEYFNNLFYHGELRVRSNEKALNFPSCFTDRESIRWIDVKNGLEGEISAAVACFEELKESGYNGTIGIICPLRDIVDDMNRRIQILGYDADDVLVQTAYGFQGGQRDVIIFVVAYNSDIGGKKNWFISSRENRNIYNVTVSRAKACLVVVGDRERIRNADMYELRALASYPKKRVSTVHFDSVWEERLYHALLEKNIVTETQRYCIGYYLDLSYENQYIKLDIEVDGEAYHLNAAGKRKMRDYERNFALEREGWKVLRFWVYELRNDMDDCVDSIIATIKGAEAKALRMQR
ncbi:MAG: AAA domain-containing protein [Sphaerochaeta sp.]|jgi:very-short-patch-repair endonuclease